MANLSPDVRPVIDVFTEGLYHGVSIGKLTIGLFSCSHMAEYLASRLAAARDRPHRDAMRLLTTELGMCDEFAQLTYLAFFGDPPTGTIQ